MPDYTKKYNLELPAYNEYYSVDKENTNFENIDTALTNILYDGLGDTKKASVKNLISDMIDCEAVTLKNIFGITIQYDSLNNYYKDDNCNDISILDNMNILSLLDDTEKKKFDKLSILSLEDRITGESNIIKDIESEINGKLTKKEITIEDHQYDVKVSELETRCDELYKLLYDFSIKCNRILKKLDFDHDNKDLTLIEYINSIISVISGGLDNDISKMSMDETINSSITKLGNAINKNGTTITGTIQDSYNEYELNNESYFRNLVMVNGITSTTTDEYNGSIKTIFDNKYSVNIVFDNDNADDIYDPLVDDDFFNRSTLIITSSLPYTFGNKIINGNMKFSIKLDKQSITNLFKPVTDESDEDYGMSVGYLIVRYILNGYSDYTYSLNNRDTLSLLVVSELPEYMDEYCVLCRIKINSNLSKGNTNVVCDLKNVDTYYNTDFAAKNLINKLYKDYEYYMLTNPDGLSETDYIANLYEARTNGTKNDGSDTSNTEPIDESYKYRDEVYELDYDNPTRYQISDIYDTLLSSKNIDISTGSRRITPTINGSFYGVYQSMPYLMYIKDGELKENKTGDYTDERDIYMKHTDDIFYILYACGDLKDIVVKTEIIDGETKETTYFNNFISRVKELGFHIRGVDGKTGYKFYQERIDYFSGDDFIGDPKLVGSFNNLHRINAKCGDDIIRHYPLTYSNISNNDDNTNFITYPIPQIRVYSGNWNNDDGYGTTTSYAQSGMIERFICTGSSGNHYNDDIYKDTDYYKIGECYDLLMVQYTLFSTSDNAKAYTYKRWFCVNLLTGEIVDKYGNSIYTMRLNRDDEDIVNKGDIMFKNSVDLEVSIIKNSSGDKKINKIINWRDASRSGKIYSDSSNPYSEKEFIEKYEEIILERISKTLNINKNKSKVRDIIPINCRCETSQWKRFCPYKLEWNDCEMILPAYKLTYEEIYKMEDCIGDEI